jgi:hypothetical protein
MCHKKASPREYVCTSLVICASSLESNWGSTPPDWNINRRLSILNPAITNNEHFSFKFINLNVKLQKHKTCEDVTLHFLRFGGNSV